MTHSLIVLPMPRVYIRVFIGLFLLAALIAGASYLLLVRSYELASPDEILDAQFTTNGLYGPASANADMSYKMHMYARVKPDVASFGSSRAMRFRETFFENSFVNMGGFFGDPKSALQIVERLLEDHKPKLFILTIDPWWFTPAENIRNFAGRLRTTSPPVQPVAFPAAAPRPDRLPNLFLPLRWLMEGKVTLSDYWPLLMRRGRVGEWFPSRLGVLSYKSMSGFAKDGSSYHDAGAVFGFSPAEDRAFGKTFELVDRQRSGFECGDHIEPAQWNAYVQLMAYLRTNNVPTVTIMPPLAGAVIDRMARKPDCYQFIEELRSRLGNLGIPYYDFFDMRAQGVTDCEFLDGYHPGDVVYARMLQILAQSGEPSVEAVIRRDVLDRVVEQYAGHAMITDGAPPSYKEVDFLALGNCATK